MFVVTLTSGGVGGIEKKTEISARCPNLAARVPMPITITLTDIDQLDQVATSWPTPSWVAEPTEEN
jgi:hypothetical protein